MAKTILIFFGILLIIASSANSQTFTEYQEPLTKGWFFVKGDLGGIWEAIRISPKGQPADFPRWTSVTLPHCYNAFDAVDPDVAYYQGPAWYRTFLQPSNPYKNGRTLLHFEGSGQKTEVYVGFKKAGEHVGGYDEWTLDITDELTEAAQDTFIKVNYGEKIPLAIRCDNSRDLEMIPSDLSDFCIYGGLYRNVWLQYQPVDWFKNVKINANVLRGKDGEVDIRLIGNQPFKKNPRIELSVYDPQGKLVVETAWKEGRTDGHFTITQPSLWSPQKPSLYSIALKVHTGDDRQLITANFGFRYFRFEKNGPFYLNGKRLLLKGTHRHEDFAGRGAAVTEAQTRAEMELIKKMGANFIRLAHYQQSKQVLDLCDSLGLLVWEEIPWCRGGLGTQKYKAQAKRMLGNMINQHYNHPSVIMWGLGNENDWPGDFREFEKDSVRRFMASLNNLAHELDSSRKTTIRRCDFCKDIVDVYSPSIWAGWYRGRYTDYRSASEREMRSVDHFFHAEWGADSHAGRHSENIELQCKNVSSQQTADERPGDATFYGGAARMSKDGDWSETYAVDLFDWTLKEQLEMPWLTGSAFWVFKDFATPIRPENPIPYVNEKGVVQRDLTPKETFYVVQSYWSDSPMVHIYGHSWPIRWGDPNHLTEIKVFSNCSRVELFVNGKNAGVKERIPGAFPVAGLVWNAHLKPGLNKVKAVAYTSGGQFTDELSWEYQTGRWGDPSSLQVTEKILDDTTSLIQVRALDDTGLVCLDSKIPVEFQVAGEAKLLENLGTTTGSSKIRMANGQACIKLRRTGPGYSVAVLSPSLGCFRLCDNPQKQ